MNSLKQRFFLLFLAIILTFATTRIYLHHSPNTDFNVAGYNIHHLFTGLVLMVVSGIPLVLLRLKRKPEYTLIIIFGIGLSLALDEWVYLIATDGSNESYLLPISLLGGIVMIGLTALFIGLLFWFNRNNR